MSKNKRARLLDEMTKIRNQLDVIDNRERINANSAAVDKCYKYRNSYGSGESWWLYVRIDGLDDSGWPRGIKFEITSTGMARIEPYIGFGVTGVDRGYIEIEPTEFRQALRAFRGGVELLCKKHGSRGPG